MKTIAEYLKLALDFERRAVAENNPKIRAIFEKQAAAYHQLVEDRAKKFGWKHSPPPPGQE